MKMFREDRDKRNLRTKLWHRGNISRSYVLAAKGRAARQGVPFDLNPEDVVIPDKCPVFGIPLIVGEDKRSDNTPSIDRVVPSKGYVKGNIVVISWRANRLKSDATVEELRMLARYTQKFVEAGLT